MTSNLMLAGPKRVWRIRLDKWTPKEIEISVSDSHWKRQATACLFQWPQRVRPFFQLSSAQLVEVSAGAATGSEAGRVRGAPQLWVFIEWLIAS